MTPEQQAQQLRSLSLFVPIGFGLQGWAAANGWVGATRFAGGPPAIVGGAIGAVVGFAIVLANQPFARRLAGQPPAGTAATSWPAVVMLVLPAVAVGLYWASWLTPAPLPGKAVDLAVSLAVPATAALAYVDLRRLVTFLPNRPPGVTALPLMAAVAVVLVWAIAFPTYFFHRSRLGGSKAFVPVAVAVTLAYMSPSVAKWTRMYPPPRTDAARVASLLADVLAVPRPAVERVEDLGPDGDGRRGRATVQTPHGPAAVGFVVSCPNRDGGYEVRVDAGP